MPLHPIDEYPDLPVDACVCARRHRLQTLPVDVTCSDWDCSLEPVADSRQLAIRMGLRMVRGLAEKAGRAVEQARRQRPFSDATDLCLRAGLDAKARECLADAGALKGLAGHRFKGRWAMAAIELQVPLFAEGAVVEEEIQEIDVPTVGEDLYSDYSSLGTTLGPHPLILLRPEFSARRLMNSKELKERRRGQPARIAGLVIGRQRPGTASGVSFVTLEGEYGMVNVVVWRTMAEGQRQELVASQLMPVDGTIETRDGVLQVVAGRLQDISELLEGLDIRTRDFR